MSAGSEFEAVVQDAIYRIQNQLLGRTVRGATQLYNTSQLVLRGKKGGRRYRIPGTRRHYTASAPGEVPAVRTGAFRSSWHSMPYAENRNVYHCAIRNYLTVSNGALLGDYLENGTPGGKMAPRPHQEKILQRALPNVTRIFEEPYF